MMPDLRETYAAGGDKRPFGAYTALRILENSFPENYVQHTALPFSSGMESFSDTASLYCCITRNFLVNEQDASSLLDFVYQGNTFFLSAAYIDTVFLNKLYCQVDNSGGWDQNGKGAMKETSVSLFGESNDPKTEFRYYYLPFVNYFSQMNDRYCRVIGYNSKGQPNCLVFFWGRGKFFIHADPRAFSNYFLLTRNNYLYMQQLLQLMDKSPERIYWNEYYARHNQRGNGEERAGKSALDEIFKHDAFTWAFWLALMLALFYILFGSKRKQRVIQVLKPNINSSVAFTQTIARLYLQEKDNKNIADKMITYFHEHTRSHYFLTGTPGSPGYIESLSRKSGVSLEKTTSLFYAIDQAAGSTEIDDYGLLALNEHIMQFYKTRK
jgi:hypothetical protein